MQPTEARIHERPGLLQVLRAFRSFRELTRDIPADVEVHSNGFPITVAEVEGGFFNLRRDYDPVAAA